MPSLTRGGSSQEVERERDAVVRLERELDAVVGLEESTTEGLAQEFERERDAVVGLEDVGLACLSVSWGVSL